MATLTVENENGVETIDCVKEEVKEHFAFFDFDEGRYLVKYKSDKDIGDDIEDAISAHIDADDCDEEYEDFVDDIMTLFGVEWEIVPCRRYWV